MTNKKLSLDIKNFQTKQVVWLYITLTIAYMALPQEFWALRKLLSPALILLLVVITIDVLISLAVPRQNQVTKKVRRLA